MKSDNKTFYIKVTMKKRWIPHFMSMLQYMEYLGGIGSSRRVTFYSDGDGDFRPKFRTFWGQKFPKYSARPVKDDNGDRTFDAG